MRNKPVSFTCKDNNKLKKRWCLNKLNTIICIWNTIKLCFIRKFP